MLGPRIAALRRDAGLSQSQLAARLKISPSAMGMYEQGRREPSVATILALAREFGVSTDYLLTGRAAPEEADYLRDLLQRRIEATRHRLKNRGEGGFSAQELAMLFAAVLTDPENPSLDGDPAFRL